MIDFERCIGLIEVIHSLVGYSWSAYRTDIRSTINRMQAIFLTLGPFVRFKFRKCVIK